MRYVAGRTGLCLSVLMMALMATLAFFFTSPGQSDGEAGLCAPSPNLWTIDPPLSWLANNFVILGIAVAAVFANKKLVFVKGQDYVVPTLFLITTAANPWLTVTLNSSTILCAANLGALYTLMNAYGRRNATQEMFVIATLAGLGSMVQYAFLLFVPVQLLAAGTLHLIRPKELCAYLFGLIAPYWTVLGLGIVSPDSFAFPQLESLFTAQAIGLDLVFILLELAVAVVGGLLCVAHNSLTIYTTSVRLMLFNRAIVIFGIGGALLACIDFLNYMAYIETILLMVSIQAANSFEAYRNRYSPWILLSVCLLYIAIFILILSA